MPECGFEILDGQVVAVSPAHEPHGSQHSKLSAILEAHCAPGYNVAIDMLTRTGWRDDFAPDVSIYPLARDPVTGGRQLEELAFEVVVTESLSHAGTKAAKLCGRGVRRVFAIDVERGRCLEWSVAVDGWEILGADAAIEDPALVPALPVRDLVSAGSAKDAVAEALLAQRNAVLEARQEAVREEGRGALRNVIVTLLSGRGLVASAREQGEILAMTDVAVLEQWAVGAATCASVAELLASR
jgi:Uma2 family endonuclease